jgi:hypothetical protein
MPVSLPERTVDAWVTAYLAKRLPDVLLWAPTQRQIPDYDVATSLPGPGKLFVLEDKAPYTNGTHRFDLQVRQIWNYLRNPHLRSRTFYVLPCPPFLVAEVPGGPSAAAPRTPDLVPRRAQSRLASHPWPPSRACEEWFRVVPVVDLWTRFLPGAPPAIGFPFWPKPERGLAPARAPARTQLRLVCPLPSDLGESLRSFIDRLLECDRPELRVDTERPDDVPYVTADVEDSPLYQALIAFAPASRLPGWTP